jgi:hypothetical protein
MPTVSNASPNANLAIIGHLDLLKLQFSDGVDTSGGRGGISGKSKPGRAHFNWGSPPRRLDQNSESPNPTGARRKLSRRQSK